MAATSAARPTVITEGLTNPTEILVSPTGATPQSDGEGSGSGGGSDVLMEGAARSVSDVQTKLHPTRKSKTKVVLLQRESASHHKSSSTSSLYVESTINHPDVKMLLNSVSVSLLALMDEQLSSGAAPRMMDIFNEEHHPLTKDGAPRPSFAHPTLAVIEGFISKIFVMAKVNSECAVISWIYIERIVKTSGLTIHATNWRRLVLASVLLASKVWEDLAVWNVDFMGVARDVEDLNHMELEVLDLLQYNVTVRSSQYAEYYFSLRNLAPLDTHIHPATPLDQEGARKLDLRSAVMEEEFRSKRDPVYVRRIKSSDNLKPRSPQAVIN